MLHVFILYSPITSFKGGLQFDELEITGKKNFSEIHLNLFSVKVQENCYYHGIKEKIVLKSQ